MALRNLLGSLVYKHGTPPECEHLALPDAINIALLTECERFGAFTSINMALLRSEEATDL